MLGLDQCGEESALQELHGESPAAQMLLYYTIPDVRFPQRKNWYIMSIVNSVIWLALLSYVMSYSVELLAGTHPLTVRSAHRCPSSLSSSRFTPSLLSPSLRIHRDEPHCRRCLILCTGVAMCDSCVFPIFAVNRTHHLRGGDVIPECLRFNARRSTGVGLDGV